MKPSALHRYFPLITALLISVLVAVLYGHTLHAPWYFDDENAILGNPQTADLSQALSHLFTQRGVTLFSFALNYNLGGGFSLPAFHLVNIVIHLLCGWLVYLLLRRVFPERLLWPLCGAMLFLAHPLQTQAVTYIVQRMTTLSALFFLLALYLFVRAREALSAGADWRARAHLAPYLGALVAGALALGAKETAAVLPLALLLFSRFILPRTEGWRPLLLTITPFLLAPLLLGASMVLLPLAHDAALATLPGFNPSAISPATPRSATSSPNFRSSGSIYASSSSPMARPWNTAIRSCDPCSPFRPWRPQPGCWSSPGSAGDCAASGHGSPSALPGSF